MERKCEKCAWWVELQQKADGPQLINTKSDVQKIGDCRLGEPKFVPMQGQVVVGKVQMFNQLLPKPTPADYFCSGFVDRVKLAELEEAIESGQSPQIGFPGVRYDS